MDEKYANTPDSDLYLDKRKPSYIGGFLEMVNQREYGYWGSLTEALRTGKQQNDSKNGAGGVSPHKALYADPARLKVFLEAMTGISRGANVAMAHKISWGQYRTFADVGTAQGDLAVQLALAHPHLSGIGFDLAEAGPIFENYVEQHGLGGRLRLLAGTFSRTRCRRRMSLSWATFCTTGTWKRRNFCSAKPMKRSLRAARQWPTIASSTTTDRRMYWV